TLVQPSPESNGTAGPEQGTFVIKVDKVDTEVVIDGLIIDRGNSISYNATGEGKPEGVECPMMNEIGKAGIGGADLTTKNVLTKQTSTFYIAANKANITLRNCAFLNSPYYGIIGSTQGKAFTVENCVFVGNRFAAIELAGGAAAYNTKVTFKNNTLLFNWSRLKDYLDMGYGFRYMPKTDAYVENNIIGCSIYSGLDRGRSDSDKKKDAERVCTSVNNVFFLNKLGDLAIPGGGKFLFVKAEDFEEVELLTTVEGNKKLTDPAVFKGVINEAYLNGFLGTMKSSASMFANRYPWEDALKFFGAVDGVGAQKIQY
ncbi:MAG: right-handed parallel beta-helix repeat-containing protein, partial [Kiritimatiellaeota bacterium]|nr:right-handed parallel beta-helix repeat-containing protein [Kiritimatiellota bacterium]